MAQASELKPVVAVPGRPLYLAVKDTVRAAIDAGQFEPGDQLPSTKALSERLNVSLVTVHRALHELVSSGVLRRGQGRGTFVHEEYLERQTTARGLRLGVVFHAEASLADFYHGQVLEGARRAAAEHGADLVLLQFGEDWRRECQGFLYVNPLREQLSRMPWFGAENGRANGSRRRKPPVMAVGASFDHDHVHSVDCDNADLAAQAVAHLVGLGHQRIAYVGGGAQVSNNVDRWRGFRAGMTAAGLPVRDAWCLRAEGWSLDEPSRAALAAMLTADAKAGSAHGMSAGTGASAGENAPTAVFAAGYYFALDVYAVAASCGLTVGRDVSVVGVDDPPSAQHLSPPLTTLRQPLHEMGRRAALGLMRLFDEPTAERGAEWLRAELVARGSSGPCRGT